MNSVCSCNIFNEYGKIIWKFPRVKPPVLFIDNQLGYIGIESATSGRRGESLSWSNTKYCMGFTFFSNDENIGVGIVQNGELFSIATARIEDFFEIAFDGETSESSIICAVQIDYDTIFIAAATMYNGKVTYGGKTLSARGLAVATRTRIQFPDADEAVLSTFTEYFNELGESSKITDSPKPGDMIVTYETYNEAHGFSDVSTQTGICEARDPDAMTILNKRALRDIRTLTSTTFPEDNVVTISSAVHNDEIFMIVLLKNAINISIFNGTWSIGAEIKEFKNPSCQTIFDNMYEGRIFISPPDDMSNNKNYDKIYAPPGVFFRYNTFSSIIVSVPYNDTSYTYRILTKEGSSMLDWSLVEDSEDENKLVPSDGIKNSLTCDEMIYSVAGDNIMMNFPGVYSENIVAAYLKTTASKELLGDGSIAIKSMSLYIPYIAPQIGE